MPPPGPGMHNPQFSPLHPPPPPPPHLNGGALIPGSNAPPQHPHHLPFNNPHSQHHQQHHHMHHMSPTHHNGQPLAVDLNNNSLHMYNQPSLMLATPMNPGQQAMPLPQHHQPAQVLCHSSASSEAGPADSESTSPTDSGGESTLSSNHSGSNPNLATATDSGSMYNNHHNNNNTTTNNGGSQPTFYHQNGIIATQMTDECQKMGTPLAAVNNQYVSLFIL